MAVKAYKPELRVVIDRDFTGYSQLCSHVTVAPPQHPDWVHAWTSSVNKDVLLVQVQNNDGELVLALPLEVVKSASLRVARFMGGSHANGNFPVPGKATHRLDASLGEQIRDAVRSVRPDIDLVVLERMAAEIEGEANPLLCLKTAASPNVALAINLTEGFDSVVANASGRKAKRYRSQLRKFEELGGAERIVAASLQDVEHFLGNFFEMKAHRLRAMGIGDVFAEPGIQAFFRDLFIRSLGSGRFTLEALEVGGKLRAISGHSRCGDRIICEFGAIAEDELVSISPGDYLFYTNIKAAADRGFIIYDFSVGDEPYKRSWCDIEQHQFDVVVPLSAKGKSWALLMNTGSRLKARIKAHPVIWPKLKKLRQRLRGSGH